MRRIHHYTILELLVVVAIAAVILGIATPAFSVMMKGSAMTSTTRELAAKIKAARSYAVTNNTHVAVLFPTEKDCSDIRLPMNSSVYRPCVVYREGENKWVFDSWIDGESWHTMERGITMIPFSSGNDLEFRLREKPWDGGTTKAVKGIEKVPLGSLKEALGKDNETPKTVSRAVIFKPNGQLAAVDVQEQLCFRLIEGSVIKSGSAAKAIATNVFTEGANTYLIAKTFAIHPLTSKMTIEDLKFEWTPSSSSLKDKKVE